MYRSRLLLQSLCLTTHHTRRLMYSWKYGTTQLPELPTESMFTAACSDFVKSTSTGALIPVPTINLADNVKPLQLVIKTRTKWMYLFERVEYRPTEFQMSDLLTDSSDVQVPSESSNMVINYNKTAKVALKGKIGANIAKNILGLGFNITDSVEIDVKFNTVQKCEVDEPDLLKLIGDRRMNLDHQYIRQIREDHSTTLCVITAVSDLASGGVIKQKTGTDVSATATAKLLKRMSVSGGTGFSKGREIILPINTPVAYRVRELVVDTESGAMELALSRDMSGGFVTNIGTNGLIQRCEKCQHPVSEVERQLDTLYRPILQLSTDDRVYLRALLLELLSVPRDICILADIIDVNLARPYSIQELEDMLILPQEKWLPLITMSGFNLQDDQLTPPEVFPSLYKSIGDLLDALTVLDDDILDLIPYCSQQTANTLMKIVLAGMRGENITDSETIDVLHSDTVSTTILQLVQFDIQDRVIYPPTELSPIIDELYYVLTVLWS